MKIEIHILQSFPPANLNRDENGMPKSCVFGGRNRARISSQCQKRAARKFYHDLHEQLGIDPANFAKRSRNIVLAVESLLIETGIEASSAKSAAKLAIAVLTVKEKKKKGGSKGKNNKATVIENDEGEDVSEDSAQKDDLILFLGDSEYRSLASLLIKQWNTIEPLLKNNPPKLPDDLKKRIKADFEGKGGKPGDVALFGRMMTALPHASVDASVQVAHAIGVNALEQEFDFFTAVDDLSRTDEQGADHLGETGYNSSTYYRFAVLDTKQLISNLGNPEDATAIAHAFIEAFIKAIPSGHQNSFAAHSLPAIAIAVVRTGQPVSLVDAFENPVRPSGSMSLLEKAVKALDTHYQEIQTMYGNSDIKYTGFVTRSGLQEQIKALQEFQKSSLDILIDETIKAAFEQDGDK